MTSDEVDTVEHLALSAGLIKVWDGEQYLDLRIVVKELCQHARNLQAQVDVLQERAALTEREQQRLLTVVDEAHAEIAMLGSLLREP
jgi:hypothetical protein